MGRIVVDKEKLVEILKERDWTQKLLAEKMGVAPSTLSHKINENDLSTIEYRLMCMILGRAEDELIYKPSKPQKASNEVESIIELDKLVTRVNELEKKLETINEGLVSITRLIMDIQKAIMETKAQT